MFKKTLLIDLDGVLNEYNKYFDETKISPIKRGAENFIKKLHKKYKLKLYTTRNKLLAAKWLINNNIDEYFDDITNIKELSWLTIDDRCITFRGNYDEMIENINNFEVWYKNS